jgi:predicted dehydrogenase
MTVNFEGGNLIAHFNCSWISPVKLRNTLIGGDKKMVLYNDMEPTEKVKVYDTGFKLNSAEDQYKLNIEYRVGDIYVPKVPFTEALSAMAADFVHAINTGSKPIADMYLGRDVVRILEASQKSIKNKGAEIEI